MFGFETFYLKCNHFSLLYDHCACSSVGALLDCFPLG